MTPTKITYPSSHEAMLLPRDVKLILRIRQIARRHGAGTQVVIVINDDGTYGLIPPPPATERIG